VAQSSTEPHWVRHASAMQPYGAQLVCLPVRSLSVWLSAQMTRETHVFVEGSHDAFDAQSPSLSHLFGQSVVPLHL
jgi:hypothetical protein